MNICVSDNKEQSGYFAEGFETELKVFCPWIGGDLQVFDVNHDGYDDLICHTSTGIIQISESHIVDRRRGEISTEQEMDGMSTEQDMREVSAEQSPEEKGLSCFVHVLYKVLMKISRKTISSIDMNIS